MSSHLRSSCVVLLAFTGITGLVYPLLVTLVSQTAFSFAANGSLLAADGTTFGSTRTGQPFGGRGEFWSRPSASSPFPYAALPAGGSNAGPLNAGMLERVEKRVAELRASDPENREKIPVDLVTASGSGLDPHISLASARWQVPRVARELGIDVARVDALVESTLEDRQFGVLGEPRVNVFLLNRSLRDVVSKEAPSKNGGSR